MKTTLAGKHHYLMYFLATAMKPRMLLTLDEDGKLLPVPCRVGAAVDTVAQVRQDTGMTDSKKSGNMHR